ncbi:MAG: hypothetical protein ACSHXW_20260 [Yoonia sp.]
MDEKDLRAFQGVYECPDCRFSFVPSEPNDWAIHKEQHQFVVERLKPISISLTGRENIERSLRLLWPNRLNEDDITTRIRQYAAAFKREMGTDFIQWEGSEIGNVDVHPFLMIDDDAFVGGGLFRLGGKPVEWVLDWIWLCPPKRRSGLLRSIWTDFVADKQALNSFEVSQPVSKAMKSFLTSIDWSNAKSLNEF